MAAVSIDVGAYNLRPTRFMAYLALTAKTDGIQRPLVSNPGRSLA